MRPARPERLPAGSLSVEAPAADAGLPAGLGPQLALGGLFAAVGRGVTLVSALFASALVTRLLAPADVGGFFLITSLVTVAATCGQLGLPRTAVRLLGAAPAERAAGEAASIIGSVLRLALLGGVGVSLLMMAGPGALLLRSLGGGAGSWTMAAAGVWALAVVLERTTAEIFRGRREIGRATLLDSALSSALFLVALVALLLGQERAGWHLGIGHLVAVAMVCRAAVAVLGTTALGQRVAREARGPGPAWRDLIEWSFPVLLTTLVAMLWNAAGLWILGAVGRSPDELASFGVATRLAGIVGTPLLVANAVVMPVLAELHSRGETRSLERVLRLSASVATVPALVALLVGTFRGEAILGAVYGSFYRGAAPLLAVLGLAHFLNVVSGSCGVALLMSGRQTLHLRLNLLSLGGVLAIGVPMSAQLGAAGMAVTVLAASLLQQVVFVVACRRELGVRTWATWRIRPLRYAPAISSTPLPAEESRR